MLKVVLVEVQEELLYKKVMILVIIITISLQVENWVKISIMKRLSHHHELDLINNINYNNNHNNFFLY